MIEILDSNDKKELQENIDKKIEKPDIAVVGQVIAVEEVDEDGKPIKFKAINMSGGSNGSGSEEVDPTVYNWAKQPTKPSYTAGEVGALPASTFIPTMTSQLTNDSKYQTEDQVKSLINSTISGGTHFTFERVSELPETGVENIIYLLGEQDAGSYIEYIWINNESRFEPIGSTDIDLSNVLEKSGHVPNMYLGTDAEGNVIYKTDTVYEVSVDSYLSTESENPVQNKVVAKKINDIENNVSQLSEQNVARGTSLWAILKKTAFAEALTDEELNNFKTAWGITDDNTGEEEEPEEPDNPEVTLSSISATYTGGEVTVGTALTDLTGITVTARYSDGSTANVTGYTLNGSIVEGSNTITVTYQGKTTTFTVTGVAESGGGEETGVSNETEWSDGVPYTLTLTADAYVKKDGSFGTDEDWSRTNLLYCKGASNISFATSNGTPIKTSYYNCFYDENKTYLSNFSMTNSGIAVPENASYVALSNETVIMEVLLATPNA